MVVKIIHFVTCYFSIKWVSLQESTFNKPWKLISHFRTNIEDQNQELVNWLIKEGYEAHVQKYSLSNDMLLLLRTKI